MTPAENTFNTHPQVHTTKSNIFSPKLFLKVGFEEYVFLEGWGGGSAADESLRVRINGRKIRICDRSAVVLAYVCI